MRDLHFYIENPFDSKEISMDELIAFTTDHLQRMVANNPGALFNTRITATTTKLSVVENCLSDDQSKLGLRKGKKLVKDTFRKSLPKNVEKIWAAVVAKYGGDSPEELECFPQGRKVFSTGGCTDDHVENHLQTLITGVTAHTGDLGAAVVNDASGLLSTWLVVYNASEASTGAKTTTEAGKKTARENLQLELFLNLLEIAKNFPRQTAKVDLYMQQSLLEDAGPSAPEQAVIASAVLVDGTHVKLIFDAPGATKFDVLYQSPAEEPFHAVATNLTVKEFIAEVTTGENNFKVVPRNSQGDGPESEVTNVTA